MKQKKHKKEFLLSILVCFIWGGFFMLWTEVHSSTDADGDGYASEASGGNDCVDSLSSVYLDNDDCDDLADPVFLEGYDDPDGTDDIADHAWIEGPDGTWHLYFHWNNPGNNNTDIAHFTTSDFKTIAKVGHALENDTDKYYDAMWAPYVLEHNGTYYMYFTGVEKPTNPWSERVGLATSTDLTNWTMYPENNCAGTTGQGCIYECDNTWTTWGDGGGWDEQCRDPMVIRDETNNRWVMFNTARHSGGGPTVDVAYSTNLIDWTGAGYIEAANVIWDGEGAQKTGGQAENPFVTEHNGTYYLTWSDWQEPVEPPARVQYATSTTLTADASGSSNWVYQGHTPDSGVNAIEVFKPFADTWLMTQSISNETAGDDAFEHPRDLRIKRIIWADDGSFTTSRLTDLSCRLSSASINPGAAEICGDGYDNNCSGEADEDYWCAACTDNDGDGYGTVDLNACLYSGVDCDDTSDVVYPGAPELCDLLDNDCDGIINEGIDCTCNEDWSCSQWSECINSTQTRTCTDINSCGTTFSKPNVSQSCTEGEEDSNAGEENISGYLAPPTVVYPEAGFTIDETRPTITGLSRANNTIFIFIDDELENTVLSTDHSSGTGSFFYKLRHDLTQGEHTLYTIARNNEGIFSAHSPKIAFKVKSPYIAPTLFEPVFEETETDSILYIGGVANNNSVIKVYLNDEYLDEFQVRNNKNSETTSFIYELNLGDLTAGFHSLYARAYDLNSHPSRDSNLVSFTKSSLENAVTIDTYQFSGNIKYTVKAGDSLWKIAKRLLGDGSLYKEIAEANQDTYSSLATNYSLIQVGWQLTIP